MEKPKRKPASRAKKQEVAAAPATQANASEDSVSQAGAEEAQDSSGGPRKGGWWQRTFGN